MPTDHEFITPSQKTQFLSLSTQYGKPAALFSHKRKSSQETLFDREGISSEHQPVPGNDETLFRFSDPKMLRDQFFKNKEIIYSQKQNLKS